MEKTYADSITSEAVNLLPTGSFPGEIVVVDRSELIADACATCVGACLGTSTVTTFSSTPTDRT